MGRAEDEGGGWDAVARDFLLEIGTEEMPARYLDDLRREMARRVAGALAEARLGHEGVTAYSTPRRLTVVVRRLAAEQAPSEERVRGPAARVAFDADGKPTPAARGFAARWGLPVEELAVEETPQGRYVFARLVSPGRPAEEVLAEVLPPLVADLPLPRTMRWGDLDFRFLRPIRWVMALHGDRVVDLEVAGLRAGRVTFGHRVLGPGPLVVASAEEYEERLLAAGVMVDQDRRRETVRRQVEEVGGREGGRAVVDEDLLAEVTNLVEFPTAFTGRFPERFLELPREVVTTPMRHHQRYFPVEVADGRLLPLFVGVRNGGRDHLANVVAGNERVLRARLADARFFFEEDTRRPLADYVPRLGDMVFQERLGTVLEKAERVRSLAGRLAGLLGADAGLRRSLDRAAYLCKADLATAMVFEFPELEGVMGREYALRSGEPPEVAAAIAEHRLPRHAGDALPATEAGALLAVADKADTLVGCFAAGLLPTGSHDPYALRRQALGLIQIFRAWGGRDRLLARLGLDEVCEAAWDGLPEEVRAAADAGTVRGRLEEFFLGRLRVLLGEGGCAHPLVEAVLAVGWEKPALLWERIEALAGLQAGPTWEDAVTVARRVAGLGRRAEPRPVDPDALTETEERGLWEAVAAAAGRAEEAAASGEYAAYLQVVAGLRGPVDAFLDGVLVMAPEEEVRANRLALLARADRLCRLVADLASLA